MPSAPGARNSYRVMTTGVSATPEQIMGTCRQLELEAAALYRRFQLASDDPELCCLWEMMYREETHHARMIEAFADRRGFTVPAISHDQLIALVERVEAIRREAEVPDLSEQRMLSIAAALEFSEMDDLFSAICRTAGAAPDGGRPDHLAPLIEAVLARSSEEGALRHILAATLRLRRRAHAAGLAGLAGPTGPSGTGIDRR
jgi:hypothetical protein